MLDDVEYRTPDLAAHADGEDDADGWEYWSAACDEPVLLSELRSWTRTSPHQLTHHPTEEAPLNAC